MNQLELLWELQVHDNKLNSIKKDLSKLEKAEMIDDINFKIKKLERDIKIKKSELDKNDERIRKNNLLLEQLNYELKEVEKNLYSGNITDLQQLDYMDKERKSSRDEINKIELKILSLMEEIEDLKEMIKDIEYEYDKMRTELKKYSIQNKTMIDELKKESKIEIKTINEIISKIDKDLIEKYNMIKTNKGYAVARISKNECSGCHMIISTYLINKVKNRQDILKCENCGRILFYKEIEK